MNAEGLYQYSDAAWGSSPAEAEKFFGEPLGEPYGIIDSVKLYKIDGLYTFEGIPAQVKCEFFNDKLYQVQFTISSQDADLDSLFSIIAEKLCEEYGSTDMVSTATTVEVLNVVLESDHYLWESSSGELSTALLVEKASKNGVKESVSIYVIDLVLASRPTK